MDIVYSHWLALNYWRRASARGSLGSLWGLSPVVPDDTQSQALPRRRSSLAVRPPSSAVIDRLDALGLWLDSPSDLLVARRQDRRSLRDVRCHVCTTSLPAKCLHPIVHRGRPVPGAFACSPELAFVQVAPGLELPELVLLGLELCGSYRRIHGDGENETAFKCPPVTSRARLERFVAKAGGMRGRDNALRALRWIRDGSASPAESVLATLFTLPWRYGGANLGTFSLNSTLRLDASAAMLFGRDEITPDILFDDPRYPVEYDSKKFHSTVEQAEFDERRRNAYASLGMGCTVIRPRHMNADHKIDAVTEAIRRNLNRRVQRLPESYDEAHENLLAMLLRPWRGGAGSPWDEGRGYGEREGRGHVGHEGFDACDPGTW